MHAGLHSRIACRDALKTWCEVFRWRCHGAFLAPWHHDYSAKGPVSRILSCAVIPLGAALPHTLISDLPGGFGHCMEQTCDRTSSSVSSTRAAWAHRADAQRRLALSGSFPPYLVLLRVGFTLPPALRSERCALTAPFHPYPGAGTCRPGEPVRSTREFPPKRGSRGGIFSVALAVYEP